jgi:hypothetical protein
MSQTVTAKKPCIASYALAFETAQAFSRPQKSRIIKFIPGPNRAVDEQKSDKHLPRKAKQKQQHQGALQ